MTAIKQIREKRGLSQREFAEKMGVTQGAVSHWESGRRTPDLDTAARIARALRCTVEDLLTEKTG